MRDVYETSLVHETDEVITLISVPGIKYWDYRKAGWFAAQDGLINTRQYRGVARADYIFKGHTCIGRLEDESIFGSEYAWVPLYQRPQYHRDHAPLVEVPYHVVEKPIQWY